MAEVSCRKVVKNYDGGVQAVKGIDLEIADREFVVLVGPSGCGKSTTLRMIAGLEEITDGEIWIGGDVVNDVPPRDRDIAMVFQNYALYPHMSVFDNMAFGLKLRKFPKDEIKRRVEEASQFVDIDELCLSPQCGFASTLEGNELSPQQQTAKLRLVVETAQEIWG